MPRTPTHILTPASGLQVGDCNGAMEIVQIGRSESSSKIVVDWKLPSGEVFTETPVSSESYMVQRAS